MGRAVVVNFTSIDGVIQSPLSPEEDRDDGFGRGGWVPQYSDRTVNAFMRTRHSVLPACSSVAAPTSSFPEPGRAPMTLSPTSRP